MEDDHKTHALTSKNSKDPFMIADLDADELMNESIQICDEVPTKDRLRSLLE